MGEAQPPPLAMCWADTQKQRPALAGLARQSMGHHALREEVDRTAPLGRSWFTPLNQEGTERLSVGALPSFLLEELAHKGTLAGRNSVRFLACLLAAFLLLRGEPSGGRAAKQSPALPSSLSGFPLGTGAGAWVSFPLSLVLANCVILDTLAFTRWKPGEKAVLDSALSTFYVGQVWSRM